MRALRIVGFQQEPELLETPEPKPGPGEVVIRVGGAGACHSDLHMLYEMDVSAVWPLPMTLGHENAGWVHAMGAGVTGLSVGDAVAVYGAWGCGHCGRCVVGMENYCEQPSLVGGGGLGADGVGGRGVPGLVGGWGGDGPGPLDAHPPPRRRAD